MNRNILKNGLAIGIIILIIAAGIFPNISGLTVDKNVLKDGRTSNDEILSPPSKLDEQNMSNLTFHTFDKTGIKTHTVTLPKDTADAIYDMLEELKHKTIYESECEETQTLKNEFVEILNTYGLIPKGLSKQYIQSLLNPQWHPDKPKSKTCYLWDILQLIVRNRFKPLKILELLGSSSDWNIACNIASGGSGVPIPIIMLPRPRAIALWLASFATTATGSLLIAKSFIAYGSQQGVALGFAGVGLTITFGGLTAYGLLGYAVYTYIQAEYFERINLEPEISEENPRNGADNVPVSLSELSFKIRDPDGDRMDYSVTTVPDIGSKSEYNQKNGVYNIPVNELKGNTEYTWHISVNDEYDSVEKDFTFTTEAIAPVVSNPYPSDDARDVPVSLSQLSFKLKDYQGDLMDISVETSPYIGSFSATGVSDGTYTVDVGGLDYSREYIWYVNVTDGTHWTREIFSFQTIMIMVFDPFSEGWMYRKKITIDHNQVAGSLTGFPVLVSIIDSDLRVKAQFDSDDILFMDDKGVANRLYHEIECFDDLSGELVAWVNIPSLSSSVDTVLYMYYGNSFCGSQQYPEKVWDSNYMGVWHLDNGGIGTRYDSTSLSNDGTPQNYDGDESKSGKIYYGDELDGTNDFIDVDTIASDIKDDTKGTIAAWVRPDTGSLNNDKVWGSDHITDDDPLIRLLLYDYRTNFRFRAYCRDDSRTWKWDYYGDTNLSIDGITWYHVVLVHDGTDPFIYLDGEAESLTQGTYGGDDDTVWYGGTGETSELNRATIGASWNAGASSYAAYWEGMIDEVRISNTDRSDAWIETSYNTMNNPSSFFSVGHEESVP